MHACVRGLLFFFLRNLPLHHYRRRRSLSSSSPSAAMIEDRDLKRARSLSPFVYRAGDNSLKY